MPIQTKGHSKYLFILYFLRISSKLKNLIKIAQTKTRTITCKLSIVSSTPFTYPCVKCEYSPSRQNFLISTKPNNKGINRLCPLPNTTMCFHIKINPNSSSKRFNYCIMIL